MTFLAISRQNSLNTLANGQKTSFDTLLCRQTSRHARPSFPDTMAISMQTFPNTLAFGRQTSPQTQRILEGKPPQTHQLLEGRPTRDTLTFIKEDIRQTHWLLIYRPIQRLAIGKKTAQTRWQLVGKSSLDKQAIGSFILSRHTICRKTSTDPLAIGRLVGKASPRHRVDLSRQTG